MSKCAAATRSATVQIMLRTVLVLGLMLSGIGLFHAPTPAFAAAPVNLNASQKTKDLFNYLFNLRNNTANTKIVGQFAGFPEEVTSYYLSDVYKATGKWLALVHVDYEHGWRE